MWFAGTKRVAGQAVGSKSVLGDGRFLRGYSTVQLIQDITFVRDEVHDFYTARLECMIPNHVDGDTTCFPERKPKRTAAYRWKGDAR